MAEKAETARFLSNSPTFPGRFFFLCCVFQFKEKKNFPREREREDLNAVIMMERT